MKLLKIAALCFCVVFIQSCGEDESIEPFESADLVGTWNMTDFDTSGTISYTIEGVPIPVQIDGTGKDIDAFVEFTEDPNQFTSSGSYTIVLTTSGTGFAPEISETTVDQLFSNGAWSLGQSKLVLSTVGEASQDLEVLTLTESELTLQFEETIDEVVDGVNAEGSIKFIFSFSK